MNKLFSAANVIGFVVNFFIAFDVTAQITSKSYNVQSCLESPEDMQWAALESQCLSTLSGAKDVDTIKIWNVLAAKADENRMTDISKSYDSKISGHVLLNEMPEIQYEHFKRKGKNAYSEQSLDEAEQWFLKSLDAAKNLNDLNLISKSYNNLGVLYKGSGQYNLALKKYQESLDIKLEIGDQLLIGNTLYNVGALLLELEREPEAVEYLDQAVAAYLTYQEQTIDSPSATINTRILHVYEDLVVAYLRLGHHEQVDNYLQSLKNYHLNTLKSEEFNSSTADIVWSKYYLSIGKPEIADGFISHAMQAEGTANKLSLWKAKAEVLLAQGKRKEAELLVLESLEQATENKQHFYMAEFNQLLSEIAAPDNLVESIHYLKSYQRSREDFLAQKYDEQIDLISDEIKSQKIARELVEQQLINTEKERKISRLTNWILLSICILIISFVAFANSYLNRQREKQKLLDSIEFHKQQWRVLNDSVESKSEAPEAAVMPQDSETSRQSFNELLVTSMVEAVDVWSRHTGTNRIELAEKSKVWTVSIDNGTLRTRAMDKYMSLKHIPKNPRWRKVVRTCHFILSDSSLNTADRALISGNLKAIMNML